MKRIARNAAAGILSILVAFGPGALLVAAAGSGCSSSPAMQEEIDKAAKEAAEKEAEVGAAAKAAAEQLEKATTDAELAAALAAWQDAERQLEELETWRVSKEAELAELDRKDREEQASGLAGALSLIWPGLGTLATAPIVMGAAGLFSSRYREHLGNAVKSVVGKGAPEGGFLLSLVKAYGYDHSSKDPAKLAAVVAKVAAKKGSLTEAERAQILAELEAARAAVAGVGGATPAAPPAPA